MIAVLKSDCLPCFAGSDIIGCYNDAFFFCYNINAEACTSERRCADHTLFWVQSVRRLKDSKMGDIV